MPRALGMHYEVERLFLTDPDGRPQQVREESVLVEAESACKAAESFVRNDGARLLGPISDVPGDQCTATAWAGGRLYVITVWRLGHRPSRDARPFAN